MPCEFYLLQFLPSCFSFSKVYPAGLLILNKSPTECTQFWVGIVRYQNYTYYITNRHIQNCVNNIYLNFPTLQAVEHNWTYASWSGKVSRKFLPTVPLATRPWPLEVVAAEVLFSFTGLGVVFDTVNRRDDASLVLAVASRLASSELWVSQSYAFCPGNYNS